MRYLYLVLSAIVLWTGIWATETYDYSQDLRRIPWKLEQHRRQLDVISVYLRDYHREHGRYPSNDEGLLVLDDLIADCREDRFNFQEALYHCEVTEYGVLSLWREPLIYENRAGIGDDSFADSPASIGRRHYSLEVDDNTYIWSEGARREYELHSRLSPRLLLARVLIGAASIILFAIYVHGTIHSAGRGRAGFRKIGAVALSLLGGGVLWVVIGVILFPIAVKLHCSFGPSRARTPELTRSYLTLMEQYRVNGIITDATYKKLAEGMKSE